MTGLLIRRSNEARASYRVGFLAALAIAERWQDDGRPFEQFVEWMQHAATLLASIDSEGDAAMPLTSSDVPGNQPTPTELATQPEREEIPCGYCGLIYQQTTSGYEDAEMHAACPRCMHVHMDAG